MPLVPVTPTTRSSAVGSPQKRAAERRHRRPRVGHDDLGDVDSSSRSTTSATAPASTARAANSCPSTFSPGTQKNSVPGPTLRLS